MPLYTELNLNVKNILKWDRDWFSCQKKQQQKNYIDSILSWLFRFSFARKTKTGKLEEFYGKMLMNFFNINQARLNTVAIKQSKEPTQGTTLIH